MLFRSAEAYDPTPLLLSSHVYWNLDGFQDSQTILNHSLFLKSNEYIKGDGILARTANKHDLHLLIIRCQIPTGEIGSIAKGSALDFTTPRTTADDRK